MSTLIKTSVIVICFVLILLSVQGCTPENTEQNNFPQIDAPVSTAMEDTPNTEDTVPDSEDASDTDSPGSDSGKPLSEETAPGVVWTPFA